jgi:hypothetical protein
MPTLVELHYDPNHAPLKEFLTKAVSAAKADPKGAKFVVYRPITSSAVQGGTVSYVLFKSDDHAPTLGSSLGVEQATKLAKAASAGVKKVTHVSYKSVHSHGESSPSPYLLVVGSEHGSKSPAAREAATALRTANASSNPVPYHALEPEGGKGPSILAFPMKSLSDLHQDGELNKPRWTKGVAQAGELKAPHSRTILEYCPGSSNP